MGLYKDSGLESASLNRILDCMKVMMKEAVRRGYVNADPATGVDSFTEKFKVRGIITPDEIHELFSPERSFCVEGRTGLFRGLDPWSSDRASSRGSPRP